MGTTDLREIHLFLTVGLVVQYRASLSTSVRPIGEAGTILIATSLPTSHQKGNQGGAAMSGQGRLQHYDNPLLEWCPVSVSWLTPLLDQCNEMLGYSRQLVDRRHRR